MGKEATFLVRSQEPVCSVCIANYNGRNVIEACLQSVFNQNFQLPIEVIVHDDASTDGSAEIVCDKFPDVKLIQSERNVGFCVSNNRMVSVARGEFILLLNNDAELHEDALSTLYNYANKENIRGIIGLPQYNIKTGELIDIGSMLDLFLNPIPNKDKLRNKVGMVMGACMWLPKELWDELGGLPEWFESIAEDTYLCCLARLRGYPVVALAESGFDHWIGRSLGGGKLINQTMQTTYRRRYLSERNKTYVMLLCYPGFISCILIPLHFILLTIEGILLSIVKRDLKIWNGIYKSCFRDLWSKRKELTKLRIKIQQKRVITTRSFYSVHILISYKLQMLLRHGLPIIK
ncbi:MAG: glycosyltransferase [Syntrophaceae bacterium]|nr:glycosyltransferase [Syntrophaceae bacterium]